MTCTSLFSGSGGNALFVKTACTKVLVDAGVSFRRLSLALNDLGEAIEELDAVLFTHEHSDHVGALPMLLKRTAVPFYLAEESAEKLYLSLCEKDPALAENFCSRVRTVTSAKSYEERDLVFSPFALSHDSVACNGYVLGDETNEKRLGIATDLGEASIEARRALCGCENLVLESNHDVQMLKDGPYPPLLQERILSSFGHLSNPDCAALLQTLVPHGTKRVLLFHLSKENNTPKKALDTSLSALHEIGAEGDVSLSVAPESSSLTLF